MVEHKAVDFSTDIGRKIERRLKDEQIIWLTTVDARSTPQPRPVWFHWDGETVLIFSQPGAAKVRHIKRNPRVALNFNTDEDGGEVGVLIGEARFLKGSLGKGRQKAYIEKYAEGIEELRMTPESMLAEYRVVLLVTPTALRGF
jgi:PPOX class probable F420-dependent enzyme